MYLMNFYKQALISKSDFVEAKVSICSWDSYAQKLDHGLSEFYSCQ